MDPSATYSRYRTGALIYGASLALLSLICTVDVQAQPVDRYIQFEHPAPSVTYDDSPITGPKRRVAILRSEQSIQFSPDGERRVEGAVRHWEMLLLGLRIPYQILDDRDLEKKLPSAYKVLILPGAESLSTIQRQRISEYLGSGRSMIASGRLGYYDERGGRLGDEFMEVLFDADFREDLPEQPHGMYQSLIASTPLSKGIPPGFRFNVRAQSQLSAVIVRPNRSMGEIVTFERSDQAAFERASLMLSDNPAGARFLWMRFHPQDISRDVGQQENYQRLIINALASFGNVRSVSIENWPFGHDMALTVSALPSPGFDPLSYLTNVGQFSDVLSSSRVPVSYFLSASEITTFPSLYTKIIESDAEIGLSSDTDRLLINDSTDIQVERLSNAVTLLGLDRAYGAYPPGGFLSPDAIRALDRIGATYVVESGASNYVPGELDWWEYADYNNPFLKSDKGEGPGHAVREPSQSTPLPTIATIPLVDDDPQRLYRIYEQIHQAAGYFFLPLYPETFRPYATEAKVLNEILQRARTDNAWLAKASDVVYWWRRRQNLRLEIAFSSENEMHVDVVRASTDPLSGVVLNLHLPGVDQENLATLAPHSILEKNPDSEIVRIRMDPLTAGRTRVVLSWDR